MNYSSTQLTIELYQHEFKKKIILVSSILKWFFFYSSRTLVHVTDPCLFEFMLCVCVCQSFSLPAISHYVA